MERDKVVPLILEGYREAATEAGSSVSGRITSLFSKYSFQSNTPTQLLKPHELSRLNSPGWWYFIELYGNFWVVA